MSEEKAIRGPIAIDDVPWGEAGHGARFYMRFRILSDTRKDGRKIGIAYEELPPGKQSVPFHYHMLEEEHIIGLEGEATLRLGDKRYRIKAGDYVMLPRSTMWRIESSAPMTALLIEATNGSYLLPDKGLVGPHAIFDPAMLDTPKIDDAFLAQQGAGTWKVKIKRGDAARNGTVSNPDKIVRMQVKADVKE